VENRRREQHNKGESQLRDKRKHSPDEEADLADAPPAQKLCFNLEHESSGSDQFNALSNLGLEAQFAGPTPEEASSTESEEASSNESEEASSTESESKPEFIPDPDPECKKRRSSSRAQSKRPKYEDNAKRRPKTVKSPKESSWKTCFTFMGRLPLMLLAFVVTCLSQIGSAAEAMFGDAVGNIVFDSFVFCAAKVSQCVQQNNNRRILSGTVLLGIFVFLIMISSTFSERVSSPSRRISDSSFEALFTNVTNNPIAQTIGNHCFFVLSWIVDSGASCHICNDSSLFVNLKPCNVKISTAKSGESIVATGIGDIRLNTWTEQGHPISIVLQQVYLISEARRNLLSVPSLKKELITVLGVDNSVLAPGIYDTSYGDLKKNEQRRIPIEKVGNLFFVKTASNSSGPANDNIWVVMQRKLGFMPLNAIRSLVSRSVGLEQLVDVPFPKHFIDENSMMGKAVNRDKPGSAPPRCSAPMEIVGWDIFGPCKSPSFGLLLAVINTAQSPWITSLDTVGCTCLRIRVKCLML